MLTMLSLFSIMCDAQRMYISTEYNGPNKSVVMDDARGFKALKINNDSFIVVRRNADYSNTTVYADTVVGTILDIKLNVRTGDDAIVVAVLTDTTLTLVNLAPIGGSYIPTKTIFGAGRITFQNIISSKSPYGLAFVVKTDSASVGGYTTGKMSYSGSVVTGVNVTNPGSTYSGIVSDNTYHYLLHTSTTGAYPGTYIERHKDDAMMSFDNEFPVDTNTGTSITDFYQTTTTIVLYIKNGSGQLIKKTVNKSSFMTFFTATLTQPIGSTTNGDAAIYVTPSISVLQDKALLHTSNSYGPISITGTATFAPSYNTFRAHALGSNYFIWSAYSPTGAIKLLLMDNVLRRIDSITIAEGSSNIRFGEYQESDTTYVVYGYSMIGGVQKAKEWVLRVPYSSTLPLSVPINENASELRVYPNPANSEITIEGVKETVAILNIAGQIVKKSEPGKINISELPSGMYIIRAGKKVARFVKQ